MRFYVILTIDIPRAEYINRYAPSKRIRRKLTLTEGDEQYEYDYLEGIWEHGKHRKYCGELNRKDFEEMVSDCGLLADTVETMGSLTEFGWFNAISFRSEHYSAIVSAYVTPIPDFPGSSEWRSEESMQGAWDRVKDVVCRTYEYGV